MKILVWEYICHTNGWWMSLKSSVPQQSLSALVLCGTGKQRTENNQIPPLTLPSKFIKPI